MLIRPRLLALHRLKHQLKLSLPRLPARRREQMLSQKPSRRQQQPLHLHQRPRLPNLAKLSRSVRSSSSPRRRPPPPAKRWSTRPRRSLLALLRRLLQLSPSPSSNRSQRSKQPRRRLLLSPHLRSVNQPPPRKIRTSLIPTRRSQLPLSLVRHLPLRLTNSWLKLSPRSKRWRKNPLPWPRSFRRLSHSSKRRLNSTTSYKPSIMIRRSS